MQTGGESGRIFRIVPENFKPTKAPRLRAAKTHDLVVLLAHPNAWHRDTAARLLYERRDVAAAALLTNMVMHSQLPQARLQALQALDGLGALNEAVVVKSLRDRDERVREHAVALCGRLAEHREFSDKAWTELGALANDPSINVRYQLAFTLGDIGRPEKLTTMAQVLRQDLTNRWFQAAVLSSVSRGAGDLFVALAAAPRWRNDPAGLAFLSQLALMIGAKGQIDEVNQALDFINSARLDIFPAFTLLTSLGEGLHRIGSSFALVDPQGRLQRFFDQALQMATDGTVVENVRIAALRLLGVSSYAAADPGDALQFLLGTGESDAIQVATIDTFGRYENPAIPTSLIARWPELTQVVRAQIVTAFLSRTDRVGAVLQALEDGRMKPTELSPTQVDFLLNYREPGISQRTLRIFGPIPRARPVVVEQFKASLRTTGVAARGRDIFRGRCAECHRLASEGSRLGPDLARAKLLGKEKLLSAILEPNLEIAPGYATSVVETRGRDNLIGIVMDENEATITLRQPGDVEVVWPRRNIQSIQPQIWSLMPDGMEQGLTPQAMADLLEYIMMPTPK